jgi:hypothetical protein
MTSSTKVAGLAGALAAALLVAGCKKSPPAAAPAATEAAQAPAPAAAPSEAPIAAPGVPAPAEPMPAGHPDPSAEDSQPLDAAMKAVFAYQVTLARAETYARAVKEIRAAGEKDEKLMARLRGPKPGGADQEALAKWLEDVPELKAILKKHGLKGMDLVLMPQALMQGRIAYAREREGHPVPADRTNQTSLALHKADWKRMNPLVTDCMADLRVISGR